MKTTFTLRFGGAIVAGLFVILGGCEGFNGMMASFKAAPATPTSSVIASDATPAKPMTKEQKLDMAMAMARAAENDGNTEQAIQVYEDVIEKDSGRVEAYHRLAIVYDLKGEPKKAREYYKTAIQKAPKNAELYCDLGYSCYLQRNWSEAGDNLRRALELRPEFARAHNNLGLLLARTYHASEALAEFSKAGCDEASARCNLAFALTMEDRWQEARQQYELALEANPNALAAKKGLAALKAGGPEGDVARAQPPASLAPPPSVVLQVRAPAGDPAPTVPPPSLAPPPVAPQVPAPQADLAPAPAPASIAAPAPIIVQARAAEGNLAAAPISAGIAPPPPVIVQARAAEGDMTTMPPPPSLAPQPVVQASIDSPDMRRF